LRLIAVGNLDGRLAAAARIAMNKGALVRHADRIETALAMLQAGSRRNPDADLMMVDVAIDIRSLSAQLRAAGLPVPIVGCGIQSDAGTAVAAIHAGAREYIPLSPSADVIAAVFVAVADDGHALPAVEGAEGLRNATTKVAHATLAAETVTRALVGRTVADVERELILETLKRCLGNRTRAAGILGISIRTLRNKLAIYADEGVSVPPPNMEEIRGAA
jgi:DNA-binding NtrC family response regulator